MTIIAYARVSSTAQSLEIQEQQLHQAGAERIFAEKQSGTSTAEREELARYLAYVREGDVLRVDPAAVRAWAATNDSALVYLCIQIHQGSLQTKTREDGERVAGDLPWA